MRGPEYASKTYDSVYSEYTAIADLINSLFLFILSNNLHILPTILRTTKSNQKLYKRKLNNTSTESYMLLKEQ